MTLSISKLETQLYTYLHRATRLYEYCIFYLILPSGATCSKTALVDEELGKQFHHIHILPPTLTIHSRQPIDGGYENSSTYAAGPTLSQLTIPFLMSQENSPS
ncbi:hypothetical protein E4T47_04585 [Aureobasidium subglaciale]|nr:hypothetical protein E4T47_04585 [Aureobasidium subglaciale]